jgi:hypothetical protein
MGASAEATIATNKQNKRTTLSARATVVTFFLHAQRTNDLSDGPTLCWTDESYVARMDDLLDGRTIYATDERNQMKDMDEKRSSTLGPLFLSCEFSFGKLN